MIGNEIEVETRGETWIGLEMRLRREERCRDKNNSDENWMVVRGNEAIAVKGGR